MSFKRSKYNFKINPITHTVEKPQIFLCDRQLRKLGEIFPITTPRVKVNLNGADEVSFTVTKNIKNYNNKDIDVLKKKYGVEIENSIATQYEKLIDYSVVFVQGFGYFEVSPTVNDNANTVKTLNGNSLGETELGQLHCTLECNTDNDIAMPDYVERVIYSPDNKDASLIDKILSYAPTYEVGEVDDTIAGLQRMFSFQNEDIISCFSKIAEEINCIFDVEVTRDENGNVVRKVNIYDTQYCKTCGKRHIINGICDDCKSTDIGGIGEDTTILISTENLSNEVSLNPDGNMKNCFIVEGGDDLINDTIEGLLPSGNKKIYMFSDETKSQWSKELDNKYSEYAKVVTENEKQYEKTLELEYDINDLILYLQSGRMPDVETADKDLHEETNYVIKKFRENFSDTIGIIEDTLAITTKNNTVRQTFALFIDKGYSIKYTKGNVDENNNWTGELVIYQIQNNEAAATIEVGINGSTISYSDDNIIELNDLTIKFTTDDYENYIKRKVAIEVQNYEFIENEGQNNPKDWEKYSLNRLYSYYSGYDECIQALRNLQSETSLNGVRSKAEEFITKYTARKKEISAYMKRLENFIYYLYSYYGCYESASTSLPSSQDIDYAEYGNNPSNLLYKNALDAFKDMKHYIRYGTVYGDSEKENTDHPLYCSYCNSTNVTLNGCNQCKRTDYIVTYGTLAENIEDAYKNNPVSLEEQRSKIREECNLYEFLVTRDKNGNITDDSLYKEFYSYIREDIYENSNFVSDGLTNGNNVGLIRNAKELVLKAKQELAKSCVSQHTLSGDVHSFVAYSELNKEDFPIQNAYDKFVLGNFMRYICDGKTYKLRLSSEEFSWNDEGCELNVEFTDVVHYLGGGISDVASLVQAVGNIATTANTAKTQSEKGVETSKELQKIKDEGLQSTLSNVLSARNIDVQIDDKGILLRKYDYDLEDYSGYQMKLVDRNIVMTDDNWENARMAIGLGYYGEELKYGVWADVLVGDLIVGEELKIRNNDSSFIVDETGILLKKEYETVFSVNTEGNAYLKGEIVSDSGSIGGFLIDDAGILHATYTDKYSYNVHLCSDPENWPTYDGKHGLLALEVRKQSLKGVTESGWYVTYDGYMHTEIGEIGGFILENGDLEYSSVRNEKLIIGKSVSFGYGNVGVTNYDYSYSTEDYVSILTAHALRIGSSTEKGGNIKMSTYISSDIIKTPKVYATELYDNNIPVVGYTYSTSGNFKCYKYRDGRLVIEYCKKLTSEVEINLIDANTYYANIGSGSFPIAFTDMPMVFAGIGRSDNNAPMCTLSFDAVDNYGFARAIVWTMRSSTMKLSSGYTINGLFVGRWK